MNLYPEPQVSEITGGKIDLMNISVVCNEPQIENISVYKDAIKDLNGNRKIEIFKKDISEFPETYKNDSKEAYGIIVSNSAINIYCQNDRTFYYGILDIIQMIKSSELYEGRSFNYPDMKLRGIIEGFYGKPWSMQERLDSIKTLSGHKMNTYIYAPKDDSYHRDKWYKQYPDEELDKIKKLYCICKESYVDFVYSISPGISMKYSDDKDFNKLTAKLMQIYEIGVRNFAIMLDDIPLKLMNKKDILEFNEITNAHSHIVNSLYTFLKKQDLFSKLYVCPTLYFGRGNEEYIVKLGKKIPEDVFIFWTGRAICSQELDTRDAKYFYENTGHKPLYWDNYPVNDTGMINEMHLGPIVNRDKDLYEFSEGFVSNVMEYKESSMIPVITAAHYLWNPKKYDCSESIRVAVNEVAGIKDSESLLYFIRYCSKSCINITTCEEFLSEMMQCQFFLINGYPLKALFKMQRFFNRGLNCGCSLLHMENKNLLAEIKPWVDKYIEFNKICLQTIKCRIMKTLSRKRYIEMKKSTLESYNTFRANPIEMMNVEINMIVHSMLDD